MWHLRRAVIIEDAVTGLKAARAAGGIAVGITNTLPKDTLAPHAHLVIESLEELTAMLA
jgi:beta-phosphoglucomutase-like phosphatase (HAD superfamily)